MFQENTCGVCAFAKWTMNKYKHKPQLACFRISDKGIFYQHGAIPITIHTTKCHSFKRQPNYKKSINEINNCKNENHIQTN